MNKTFLIIGNSAAGIAAARTLRKHDQEARIICISDEKEAPYNKCFLADYIGQEKTQEQTYTLTFEQADQLRIELKLGMRVVDIASDNKKVMFQDGSEQSYDALLFATGTSPIWPQIKHISSFKNVFAFHNAEHAYELDRFICINLPKRAVVIGSGLSGLEAADALHARGLQVTVIEMGEQVLARHVPPKGSTLLIGMMQQRGIAFKNNSMVQAVYGEGDYLEKVELADGSMLDADLVIVAAGLKQNVELAQKAGIAMNQYGIQVDEHMQTSCKDIYAAGDIIATLDQISGNPLASCTWPDAMQQGMHAALAMTGNHKAYKGASIITSSAFFGLKFFSCGPIHGDLSSFEVIERLGEGYYHRYVCQDGILKGFCLIGNTQQYPKLRRALMMQEEISV